MYMFPLFLLLIFIMARTNSTYHPPLIFKRYIIIKNNVLSKILIDQADPASGRSKNAKANRNKLTYAGIVFYILFFALVSFSVVMLFLPDIPCESFIYESKTMFLVGNTLNEKLTVLLAFTLLFAETDFHFINTSKYAVEKAPAKKFTKFLYCFFAVLFSVGMVGSLWIAIASIVKSI